MIRSGYVLLGPVQVFFTVPAAHHHNVLPLLFILHKMSFTASKTIPKCYLRKVLIRNPHSSYLMILVDVLSITKFILPPSNTLKTKDGFSSESHLKRTADTDNKWPILTPCRQYEPLKNSLISCSSVRREMWVVPTVTWDCPPTTRGLWVEVYASSLTGGNSSFAKKIFLFKSFIFYINCLIHLFRLTHEVSVNAEFKCSCSPWILSPASHC